MARTTRFLLDSKGAPIRRRRRALWEGEDEVEDDDWDEDEDDWDEELDGTGYAENGPISAGVCAIDTGLLNASGQPIIRHPIRVKPGFRHPRDAYYAPTAEDDIDGSGSVVGWLYDY